MPGPPDRRRRERSTIGLLALTGMLSSLQFTLLVPALPLVPAEIHTSADNAVWLVTITLLTGTLGTPILTRLADMHGRRRLLLVSLALLVTGSVIAAASPTLTAALVGRALQGAATAVVPLGIGIMHAQLSRSRATMGIALMSGTLGVGSATGLVLSGVLTTWGGLPAIFWFSAVAGTIFGVLNALLLREAPTRAVHRFDYLGTGILAIGLTAVLLVISKSVSWGLGAPVTLCGAALAILAFVLWLPWEWRHPNPVVDVRTALRAPILQINIASFFATFGMFANHLLTMQEALAPSSTGIGLGLPTLTAGLTLAPSAVAMIGLAPVAGRALSRFGGRTTLVCGAATMSAAFLLRFFVHGDIAQVVIGSALVGCGIAFAFAAMPALITEATDPAHVAAANGVNSLVRSLSGAVASAAFAFVLIALPSTPQGGFLSDAGLSLSFLVVAAFAATACLLAIGLPGRR